MACYDPRVSLLHPLVLFYVFVSFFISFLFTLLPIVSFLTEGARASLALGRLGATRGGSDPPVVILIMTVIWALEVRRWARQPAAKWILRFEWLKKIPVF